VYSKQTNYYDLSESNYYFSLQFIEFIEFICRFSIAYSEISDKRSAEIAEKVYDVVSKLWQIKKKESENLNLLKGKLFSLFN